MSGSRRSPFRYAGALAVLAGVSALLLAACGSSAPAGESSVASSAGSAAIRDAGGVQDVTIDTGDDLRFHPSAVTVHPGKVKLTLVNQGEGAPHNLHFPDLATSFWIAGSVTSGQQASVTFDAPAPGTYQFICSIHEKQGQTGTLVVRAN